MRSNHAYSTGIPGVMSKREHPYSFLLLPDASDFRVAA